MTAIIASDANSFTFSQLIQDVLANLEGHTRSQERSSYLTADAGADDLTLSIPGGYKSKAGLIEIDYELMWAQSVDDVNGTITIAPYGRGYGLSSPGAHQANSKVLFNPRTPKIEIAKAINETVKAMGQTLPAVGTTTLTASPVAIAYELPSSALDVLTVEWQVPGSSNAWMPVRSWKTVVDANTTAFPSGKALYIEDPMYPGFTVQVVYRTEPNGFTDSGDLYSQTGLPGTAKDVLVYGACSRVIGYVDAGRIDYKTVSADMLDANNPVGSGTSLSKYFYGLYQARLQEEAQIFWRRYEPRVQWTEF